MSATTTVTNERKLPYRETLQSHCRCRKPAVPRHCTCCECSAQPGHTPSDPMEDKLTNGITQYLSYRHGNYFCQVKQEQLEDKCPVKAYPTEKICIHCTMHLFLDQTQQNCYYYNFTLKLGQRSVSVNNRPAPFNS